MGSSVLWLLLAFLCFIASAMLISYALWYWENQKILDLAKHIQSNNESLLNKGMGKRGFSTFDLSASIHKSKNLAKNMISGTMQGMQNLGQGLKSNGNIFQSFSNNTKNAAKGMMGSVHSLIKPVKHTEEELPIDPKVAKQEKYEADVEKIISANIPPTPPIQDKQDPDNATLDMASGAEKDDAESLNLFEKLELRILNNLKESGMTNYDIWLELGALYKKFGQNEKAKEVFALVLKHASDQNKEKARNELIGLS